MKNLHIAVVLLCTSLSAVAQTDFRKGFIITLEKDTVSGQIDFHDGGRAFSTCLFRKADGGESRSYAPADIAGYGFIDGRRFESKTVTINSAVETGFLEILVGGKVTLYKYREAFFADKDLTDIRQLRDERQTRIVNGETFVRNSNEYIGTLTYFMSDCPEINKNVERTKFHQRSLAKIVEVYNKCKSGTTSTVYNSKKPWAKAIFGIIGGVDFSSPTIDGEWMLFGDKVEALRSAKSPLIGISLDASSPRISERFFFTSSFLYAHVTYHMGSVTNRSYDNFITLEFHELRIPFGFRYSFAPRLVTPFLNAGLSTTIHLKTSSAWRQEVVSGDDVYLTSRGEFPTSDTQLGFWGGIGILTRINQKFDTSFEVRYEHTNGFAASSLDTSLTSSVANIQLLVGLRIK
ncbi:hypothetical protein WBG78_26530 [Chryseolinea sp. T2]|uniref:hypothetical protein n=1 Tax=Chryseolinea sp. T2 TaxID=3129255 RepID=UPI003077D741